MIKPTTIDEIYFFVREKYSNLKWNPTNRFNEGIVECDLGKNRFIRLKPHRLNEDYHNKGIYTVSFSYDGNQEGRGCGCDTWELLIQQIDRLLLDLKIVKTDTQMSIFDLL